jgi:hypothetical protein
MAVRMGRLVIGVRRSSFVVSLKGTVCQARGDGDKDDARKRNQRGHVILTGAPITEFVFVYSKRGSDAHITIPLSQG